MTLNDVFENFGSMFLRIYELDLAQFIPVPRLT